MSLKPFTWITEPVCLRVDLWTIRIIYGKTEHALFKYPLPKINKIKNKYKFKQRQQQQKKPNQPPPQTKPKTKNKTKQKTKRRTTCLDINDIDGVDK